MIIDRDVPIPMDDGIVLRADVFRPDDNKPAPILMALGPYGKGVEYKDGYAHAWKWLTERHPNLLPGSTKSYMTWETVDPEIWTAKWGYVCIRVDTRGSGRSPGVLDIFGPQETKDYYAAIEWAGVQPWSSGKVGLTGISYYAMTQWSVATLQPPHLTAMIPWEGASDYYRDVWRHGGMASLHFYHLWFTRQVQTNQYGLSTGHMDPWLKERATGPEELSEEELRNNRSDTNQLVLDHPLCDAFFKDRTPDMSKVKVPFLSAGSWAGAGLHARGNFEAFNNASSAQKWLEVHPGRHEEWFYLDKPMEMQKRFLDHFLKGVDNGWDREPPVQLHIRRPFTEEVELRKESAWPLPATNWTKFYLDASEKAIGSKPTSREGSLTFDAAGEPLKFWSEPLEQETEITGPLAATIFISSSTSDADLFVTMQAWSPEGKEVEFQGSIEPNAPLAQGWLRASHRKLDTARSLPYRPFHSHDESQPLEPNKVYELAIELWPTCIILPAGFRLSFEISGHDFERPETPLVGPWPSKGAGPWLHNSESDRPPAVFAGKTTVHTGGSTESWLMLPIIKK